MERTIKQGMRLPRRTRLFLIAHGHADIVRDAKRHVTPRILWAMKQTIPTLPEQVRPMWQETLRRHTRDYALWRSMRQMQRTV